MNKQRSKERVALLSVVSNIVLVVFKLIVGLMIGSVSIISEAAHSGVDLLAACIALFSVKVSSHPADERHPFGHGKIENISGTIEALLIFMAAIWIVIEACGKLMHPRPIEAVGWGVAVMGLSAGANMLVSELLFRVGRATDSMALQADAWHLRTDVYTSAGVMMGLAAIMLGRQFWPEADLHWIDPVAAIGVAVLISKAAYDLTRKAAEDLLDASLPPDENEWIVEQIVALRPRILGYHRLKTRKAGQFRFVEFHLLVEADMTVQDSHAITEELCGLIEAKLPDVTVTIHIEPCDGSCETYCVAGCLLGETERRRRRLSAS